jgi:hypothetical protein
MTDGYRGALAFIALILSLSAGAVLPNAAGAAREETVEARGTAEFSGRADLARERAISEAFRQAVRQALGVMVESESLVRNQILVTDQVLSHSSGFIKKYSIYSENQNDGIYTVDIRAVVSEVRLKKALDAIGMSVQKMGKPRIMLLLTESSSEGKTKLPASSANWGNGVAETRIHDLLIRKGFDFVDRRTTPTLSEHPGSAPAVEGAAKLAKAGDAEIIFTGTAISRSTPLPIAGTAIHPCQATVSVKAVNADDGEVLASHTAQAVAPHINPAAGEAEALGRAAEEVAERLSQQILANWKRKLEGTRMVRLVVSGLGGYDDLKSFKSILREQIEELEEIWERSFESSSAKIDIEIASSSQNLAEQLSSLSVQGKSIKITSFTPNVVQLTIGTRKGLLHEKHR